MRRFSISAFAVALAAIVLNAPASPVNADELTFGCVAGRVTDRQTGELIPAGIALPLQGTGFMVDGDYRVCDLVSGDYFFLGGAPGYLSQRHDGVDTCGHECSVIQNLQPPVPVRISPSEEARVDFSLTRGAGAHGRVTNARGEPVQATIYTYAITSQGYEKIAEISTDGDGNYSFPTQFWGGNHYQFYVFSEKYLPTMHGLESCMPCDPRDGTKIELTRGSSRRLDFQLQDRYGTVTGRVIDRFTRQPLAGASVVSPGLPDASATTDADGRYTLEVERKPFRLWAGAHDYAVQVYPCRYRCEVHEVPELNLGPDGTAVVDFELSMLDLWHVTPSWSRLEGSDMARLYGRWLDDVVELRMDGKPIPFRGSHDSFVEFRLPPHAEGTVTLTVVDSRGASYDLVDGLRYWRGAAPRRIRDIETKVSIAEHDSPSEVVEFADRLYFMSRGFDDDVGLWRSDGTPSGSWMVKQLNARSMTPFNGLLYFGSNLGLVRSDGTESGTQPLRTGEGHPLGSYSLQAVGSRLFFAAVDHQDQRWIWTLDQSGEPRKLLRILRGGSDLGKLGSRALFGADASQGHGIWISDGTPEGTKFLSKSGDPSEFVEMNGKAYFVAMTDPDSTRRRVLMVTDGTPGGTREIMNLYPSYADYNHLTAFRGRVYFQASTEKGTGVWSTDGTQAGTRFESPGRGQMVVLGSLLYFMTDTQLLRTDGTKISPFRDVDYGALLSTAGGRIWYEEHHQNRPCQTDPSCTELWASDGTLSGTIRMEGLVRYGGAFPTEFRDGVCFPAIAPSIGAALWCADGRSNQPQLVMKFEEREWFRGSDPSLFPTPGGRLYLTAVTFETGRELWVSDLTESGTIMLKDVNPGEGNGAGWGVLEVAGGGAVFVGTTEGSGQELWVTGGSPETTRLLAELRPGPEHGVNHLLFTIAGRAYFLEQTSWDEPTAMWSTDGTVEGTRRVLTPAPQSPVVWGSTFVFIGDRERDACTICQWDPVTEELRELWHPQEVHEHSPWMTRLENAGDLLFVHLTGVGWGSLYRLERAGPSIRVSDIPVWQVVAVGPSHLLLSRAATDPFDRLWIRRYDTSGITLDETVVADQGGGHAVVAGDRAFIFVGRDNGSIWDLWVVDDDGLRQAARAVGMVGEAAGTPDGIIFFSNTYRRDREIWRSDGTPEGTRLAWDVNPAGSSNPTQLHVMGPYLVFVAGSPEDDLEPWVVRYKPEERQRGVRRRGGR